MHSLRGSRQLARLVAAWVLVWFAAMQGTALLRAPAGLPGLVPPPAAHGTAAHQHAAGDCAADCDEDHAVHASAHQEHTGATHLVQCPACLFSTAPPPQDFALAPAVHQPAAAPAIPARAAPRAHVLAQPPARGPPRLS